MKNRQGVREEMGVYEVKTHLSELITRVQNGGAVVITKHGKPVAELVSPRGLKRVARRGSAKSADFFMADDFDAPLEDFSAYMS